MAKKMAKQAKKPKNKSKKPAPTPESPPGRLQKIWDKFKALWLVDKVIGILATVKSITKQASVVMGPLGQFLKFLGMTAMASGLVALTCVFGSALNASFWGQFLLPELANVIVGITGNLLGLISPALIPWAGWVALSPVIFGGVSILIAAVSGQFFDKSPVDPSLGATPLQHFMATWLMPMTAYYFTANLWLVAGLSFGAGVALPLIHQIKENWGTIKPILSNGVNWVKDKVTELRTGKKPEPKPEPKPKKGAGKKQAEAEKETPAKSSKKTNKGAKDFTPGYNMRQRGARKAAPAEAAPAPRPRRKVRA